jgi:hypothetical protein
VAAVGGPEGVAAVIASRLAQGGGIE